MQVFPALRAFRIRNTLKNIFHSQWQTLENNQRVKVQASSDFFQHF